MLNSRKIYKHTAIISMTIVVILVANLIMPMFTMAEGTSGFLEKIQYNEENGELTISGTLPEGYTSYDLYWAKGDVNVEQPQSDSNVDNLNYMNSMIEWFTDNEHALGKVEGSENTVIEEKLKLNNGIESGVRYNVFCIAKYETEDTVRYKWDYTYTVKYGEEKEPQQEEQEKHAKVRDVADSKEDEEAKKQEEEKQQEEQKVKEELQRQEEQKKEEERKQQEEQRKEEERKQQEEQRIKEEAEQQEKQKMEEEQKKEEERKQREEQKKEAEHKQQENLKTVKVFMQHGTDNQETDNSGEPIYVDLNKQNQKENDDYIDISNKENEIEKNNAENSSEVEDVKNESNSDSKKDAKKETNIEDKADAEKKESTEKKESVETKTDAGKNANTKADADNKENMGKKIDAQKATTALPQTGSNKTPTIVAIILFSMLGIASFIKYRIEEE